jgi:two-component system chemotaxis response regulator CheB
LIAQTASRRRTARTLEPGQKIRVFVVEDSALARKLIGSALESDPSVTVAGWASNGLDALPQIERLRPDVVTLDIHMPGIDGLETLRRLREHDHETRVVMFSSLTERGAHATLTALDLGADDYVAKPSKPSADGPSLEMRRQLVPRVKQFFRLPGQALHVPAPELKNLTRPIMLPSHPRTIGRRAVVAGIGISTGGPASLNRIVSQFPRSFHAPVLLVQHMPPVFTRLFAERLNQIGPLPVKEAVNGEIVEPGRIYVAPGDFHMRLDQWKGATRIVLDQSEPQNACRPAVDALFHSLAEIYGGSVVAAVLTGMGQDGKRGCEELKAKGAHVVAQDEATSVVWGMPGAVVKAGAADEVLPLEEIIPALVRRC